SDPHQGLYYGVYDPHGKTLKSGLFAQFNQFRLHLDDDALLHVILSSDKNPGVTHTYLMDEESLLMKRERIAAPPETHHQVHKSERVYYVDQVPDGSKEDAHHVNRVTDQSHRSVADIQGAVIYVTDRGEVYTRLGEREIRVYDVGGSLLAQIQLTG